MTLQVKRGREINYEFRMNSYTAIYIKQRALSLSVIFWETSTPREQSGGRRGGAGWVQKKKDEAEIQVNWYTHGSHRSRNKGSQRQETRYKCWTACLLSRTCLNGSGTFMAILITSTTSERSTWLCPGPVTVSFLTSSLLSCGWMYIYYMYMINHLFAVLVKEKKT